METGVLCVMIDGQPLMLTWPVDSLDFQDLVSSWHIFCNNDIYYIMLLVVHIIDCFIAV